MLNKTINFKFNHTMIRVKDAQKSLNFYTKILGMNLLRTAHYESGKFSLYFLGFISSNLLPTNEIELIKFIANQSGILELTHNWGTESNKDFQYHNGNVDPRGFGHICISVPDLNQSVRWFDENKVVFKKRPEEGSMRDIAFILDPDNYWIEIIES